MTNYKDLNGNLTLEARKLIQERLEQRRSIRSFYKELGVARVIINHEVARNVSNGKYNANDAHENAEDQIKRSSYYVHEKYKQRFEKIEKDIETIQTLIQTLSTLIEELYDTINNKLRNI